MKVIKSLTIAAIAFFVAVVMAGPAAAASPHYIKGPTVSVDSNSLTVSWKAAGLGNAITSVEFTLTGTVTVTEQCYTKSGNPVNGVPKTATLGVAASDDFPVRNGQVTGTMSVSPLSTLDCTGSQRPRILSVDYDLYLNGDSLPEVHLVG